MASSPFLLGTRKSNLAMFQANMVKTLLQKHGYSPEIVKISSEGDEDTTSELHQMNTIGAFTSLLNQKVLSGEIDFAVHSLKDLPTELESGISLVAVLGQREKKDVLITNTAFDFNNPEPSFVLATGSQRRKAQWLNKYPNTKVVSLRGNIETRIQKLQQGVDGIIMAKTALERLKIELPFVSDLDIATAPGQGLIGITVRSESPAKEVIQQINDTEMMYISQIERQFMSQLEGGCSAPIAADCHKDGKTYHFFGEVLSLDGTQRVSFSGTLGADENIEQFVKTLIEDPNKKMAKEIIQDINRQNQQT